MQPFALLRPALEIAITTTTTSTTTLARTPPTIHFSRLLKRRGSVGAWAWPGGRISTAGSLGAASGSARLCGRVQKAPVPFGVPNPVGPS